MEDSVEVRLDRVGEIFVEGSEEVAVGSECVGEWLVGSGCMGEWLVVIVEEASCDAGLLGCGECRMITGP